MRSQDSTRGVIFLLVKLKSKESRSPEDPTKPRALLTLSNPTCTTELNISEKLYHVSVIFSYHQKGTRYELIWRGIDPVVKYIPDD